MAHTIIAPIGEHPEAFFAGMKHFTTTKAILISEEENISEAEDIAKQLKEFTVQTNIIALKGDAHKEMFRIFGEVLRKENPGKIKVNLATGGGMLSCAALAASYANGLEAFEIFEGKAKHLPIMKMSYYEMLSPNKKRILETLSQDSSKNLTSIGKELGMSVALLSYHINGTAKHKGLKTLRVIETQEEGKQVKVKLSHLGWLLLQGYTKEKS